MFPVKFDSLTHEALAPCGDGMMVLLQFISSYSSGAALNDV